VLCGEPRCFANRLNAPARRVCPLTDDKITLADAASIQVGPLSECVHTCYRGFLRFIDALAYLLTVHPLEQQPPSFQSVYNTSHHALVNLARMRKGERVLIHGGAGGIGHAAISIAKHLGAEIYATAGTDEKRQLVRDMGVEHVYNSRNTSWFEVRSWVVGVCLFAYMLDFSFSSRVLLMKPPVVRAPRLPLSWSFQPPKCPTKTGPDARHGQQGRARGA
jgi:hypothetical protein